MRDSDGRPKEIIGFWSSITERKQAEEQAVRALKQEFERDELIRSSDRNMAVGTVIGVLIIGSILLLGVPIIGLTIFVVCCSLGLILIWLDPL